MKKLIALILIALVLVPTGLVLASDISDAEYSGVITVSNNSTAAQAVSVNMSKTTDNLIAVGLLNAAANNCAIQNTAGIDINFMPAPPASANWCVFVPAINANSYLSYVLYTGTVTGGAIRYFPGEAGMTTSDFNMGTDNFTWEWDGWFDAAATGNISYKEDAYKVSANGSGNVATAIMTGDSSVTLRPDGAGDETNLTPSAGNNWDCVSDENDATYVHDATSAVYLRDLYTCEDHDNTTSIIDSVTIYFRIQAADATTTAYGKPAFKINGTAYDGAEQSKAATGWSTKSQVYTTSPDTSAAWTWTEVQAMQIGVSLKSAGTDAAQCSEVYIIVAYRDEVSVEVSTNAISSGEHNIGVSMEDPFVSLWVDQSFDPTSDAVTPIADNLVMNAPLWQEECDADPFTTIDSNAFSLNPTNGPVWTLDEGYSFDGTDDYIDCGNSALLQPEQTGGDLSIWGWWYGATGGGPWSLLWGSDAANTLGFGVSGNVLRATSLGISDAPASSLAPTLSAWNFIGMTWDGTNIKYYLNNTTEASQVWNPAAFTQRNKWIGNAWAFYEAKKIGQVALYDSVLSDADMLQCYNATKSKYTTGDIYTYSTLASVPDNANDIIDCADYVMPYDESVKRWVGGALVQSIAWEYDTVFSDLSGEGNDATPSFRTGTSDPDVSAALSFFGPVSEADAPAYSLSDPPDFITTTPGATGNFSTTVNVTVPGSDVIKAVAIAGGVPEQLVVIIIATMILLIISFAFGAFARAQGHGSLFVKSAIITVVMCIYVAVGIMNVWQVVFFVILALGWCWMSRQREAY